MTRAQQIVLALNRVEVCVGGWTAVVVMCLLVGLDRAADLNLGGAFWPDAARYTLDALARYLVPPAILSGVTAAAIGKPPWLPKAAPAPVPFDPAA